MDCVYLAIQTALLGVLGMSATCADTAAHAPRAAVVLGEAAPELERFAAHELSGYLQRLFGVVAEVGPAVPEDAAEVFLLGTAASPLPALTDQGILLRRVQWEGHPAFVVAGGSPAATLWAVYELAERWGVRHLLHGDMLPPQRQVGSAIALALRPGQDELVLEPIFPVRQWRVVNDFALGPESWGIADYRPVLDQLAKLKFNRIFVSTWTYQPFLDLQIKGVRRQSATLWYDYHYPITEDMIGRALFPDVGEFWNPDLPRNAPYKEFAAAGERHIRAMIAHAKQRGMQVVMTANLTEFAPEFALLLPGAQPVHQLGAMGIVPGPETDVDDPALTDLALAVLKATANTYPEVDFISLGMPEFRQWSGVYERAWQALDRKYGIEAVCPLRDVIAAAERRTGYPGGAERALQEVRGDIAMLYFHDRLITDLGGLRDTKRPDARVILNSVAEELFPVLGRILPPGSEALDFVDYTPSRIVKRREALRSGGGGFPRSLIFTLHDDNVGVLPQLTTGSLHELVGDMRAAGWSGFSTRYWLIGDHDPCIAYLARAAWDRTATPDGVYRDQIARVCGEACVEDMLSVLREVEATTVQLEWHGLGLTFPVPGMMMEHWEPGAFPEDLAQDREGYRRALAAAQRARGLCADDRGREYVGYWIGRLEFGIGYLDAIEALRRGASLEAAGDRAGALNGAQAALAAARAALEAYASVARDRSDLGAIAVMNEYVYRPLRAKVEELAGG